MPADITARLRFVLDPLLLPLELTEEVRVASANALPAGVDVLVNVSGCEVLDISLFKPLAEVPLNEMLLVLPL